MNTFKDLGVLPTYIKGLNELGIQKPTQIQIDTIPVLLKNNTDFVGLAQTGTGKTAAFGLPLLHKIDPKKTEIQGLILTPTRELAQQIKKQLFKFTKYLDAKIFVEGVYGGEKIEKQIKALQRTTHIVVATPGRLLDLIERGDINIGQIHTLILDEADEMLNMGFKQDLNKILRYSKGKKHTWLFSATMPEEIQKIIKTYLSDQAVRVEVNKNDLINANITHQFIKTSIADKDNLLVDILERKREERGIIFCKTKLGAQKLATFLKEEGFATAALEGDMQQKDRDKVMRAFKNKTLQYLVSTDVAARGIDVTNLGFVIHHRIPEQLEYYTHRSGRTARAGKRGYSIALVIPSELPKIKEIEKKLEIKFVDIT